MKEKAVKTQAMNFFLGRLSGIGFALDAISEKGVDPKTRLEMEENRTQKLVDRYKREIS